MDETIGSNRSPAASPTNAPTSATRPVCRSTLDEAIAVVDPDMAADGIAIRPMAMGKRSVHDDDFWMADTIRKVRD
jgi:hypothetical protein